MAREPPLWSLEWRHATGVLRAEQPFAPEVRAAAGRLAAFYNDPHNRRMLTNTGDMAPSEVVAHYQDLARAEAASFLLTCDGALVGDADLRHIADASAEAAILIGDRARQGQGLGGRFAILLHAFAFQTLGLKRTFASILSDNAASLRLFARLGYQVDASPAARAFADDPGDVTLALQAQSFLRAHQRELAQIIIQPRQPLSW